MVQKFKGKPVEIEAIQYTGKNDFQIANWSNDSLYPSPVLEPSENNQSGSYLQIKTSEGVMTAIVGDWIIKGVKGEFYPCKNDVFLMTYDVVIPTDVLYAQKFIQECHADMGFMGSPEYDRQKKIVDAYFEPLRQQEKEDLEMAEYLKLKAKINAYKRN
jgi:hypothetical protein